MFNNNRPEMNTPEYKTWRNKIFYRDDFKCQNPDCPNPSHKKIEAHHIERWVDAPQKRYLPSNGIVLCEHCHKKIEGNEEMYAEEFKRLVLQKQEEKFGPSTQRKKRRPNKYIIRDPRNRYS